MSNDRCILRVAVPTHLFRLFDYLPPIGWDAAKSSLQPGISFQPGMRVRIPFGRSERIGIISEITTDSPISDTKLKAIHEVLDDSPLFPETIQKLIHFASQYYHCALGEVYSFALPVWLRKGNKIVSEQNSNLNAGINASINANLNEVLNTSLNTNLNSDLNTALNTDLTTDLNSEQQAATETICKSIGKFNTFLLDGVTGSGKTEVYMHAIEQVLLQNKQALVLVPEIGLTPQMLERFEERFTKRFKVKIAVLHSSISEKKRFNAWNEARNGSAAIVIGTRSASFVPLKNPGIFIIDEEHDNSFKQQQDSFRYNARDLLVLRGSLEQCPVVLGSATPSLETLNKARSGRYQYLRLSKRAGIAKPPEVRVLDIRHRKLDEGLSAKLIHEMKHHIDAGSQVLLFLNRRGFAPVLMCYDCGGISACKQCDAHLTLHAKPKRLMCHHCETSIPVYDKCPTCNSLNLQALGFGTERLEAALQRNFPDQSIVRIDRDTTRRKGTLKEAVDRVTKGEAHILLGTQMIAKGHHFPNVTLVAVLDIDNALFSSDFRSLEKLGQLLTQVAGRAGRAARLGTCILQTCHPEHPLLNTLLDKGYHHFAESLLSERLNCNLPPFSHQALIRVESKKNEYAFSFLKDLKKFLHNTPNTFTLANFHIMGPVPALMEKRAGLYRAQLLLQSSERSLLQKNLKKLVVHAAAHPLSGKIKWNVDVDPIEMS